jgi:outer membrane protein assembly factor BamD
MQEHSLRRFCTVQLNWAFVIVLFVGVVLIVTVKTNLAQNNSATSERKQENLFAQERWLYEQAASQLQWNHPEVARQLFTTLIEEHPDSSYLPLAKLGIADSFYQEEGSTAITKARQLYYEWLKTFSDNPLADEVSLKLADASMKLAGSATRGEGYEMLAFRELKALLNRYPDTLLRPQVEERLQKVEEILAMHNLKVALFNLNLRQAIVGAQIQLLVIIRDYPHFSQMAQVLCLLAKTYQSDPDADDLDTKDANTAEAIKYYQQLICQFPDSSYAKEANDQLQVIGSAPSTDCNARNSNPINF